MKALETLEHHLRTALQILEGLKEELKKHPHVPLYIRSRRGKYTANYLSEFITPYNRGVEEVAHKHSAKRDDELILALFNVIAPYPYVWDDRAFGYDRWNFPVETLNSRFADCEDGTFLLTSLLISAGFPRDRVWAVLGTVRTPTGTYGHAWVEVKRDEEWYLLETTLDEWLGWLKIPEEYKAMVKFHDKDGFSVGQGKTKEPMEVKLELPKINPVELKELLKKKRK